VQPSQFLSLSTLSRRLQRVIVRRAVPLQGLSLLSLSAVCVPVSLLPVDCLIRGVLFSDVRSLHPFFLSVVYGRPM